MSIKEKAQERFDVSTRIRARLIEGLELPDNPELVDFDTPLVGRGLELDSLDLMEVVTLLDDDYTVQVSDDDRIAFGSINRLTDRVMTDPALVDRMRSEQEASLEVEPV
ncbi:MAG: phosphopantetheine-binding protein [Propionibacteriaceae bacterium]|nr:phosphopantetheine-binding protein [Propionibacteriaceae bacterium]